MHDKSLMDDMTLRMLHDFLNSVPVPLLKLEEYVDQDFDLEEHNKIWAECYPIYKTDDSAAFRLEMSCLGKKVNND